MIAEIRPAARSRREKPLDRQHAGSPCRSPADAARGRRRASRRRPAGLLAARRHQRRATIGPTGYFEAMMATVTRGWAPLRGVLVGRREVHRSADHRAVRPRRRSEGSEESRALAAVAERSDAQHAAGVQRRAARAGQGGSGRDRRAPALARLHRRRQRRPARDLHRSRRSQAADRDRADACSGRRGVPRRPRRRGRQPVSPRDSRHAPTPRTRTGVSRSSTGAPGTPRTRSRRSRPRSAHGVTQREVRIKLGQYLAESGQAARAIALLEHDTGDDPDALIALGNAYQLTGRHDAALATFRRSDRARSGQRPRRREPRHRPVTSPGLPRRRSLAPPRGRQGPDARRRLHGAWRRTGGDGPESRGHRGVDPGRFDRRPRRQRPVQPDDQSRRGRPS